MIIVAIVALSGVVLALVWAALSNMPPIPPDLFNTLQTLVQYTTQGAKLLMSFVYGDVVVALLGILLAFIAIYEGYKFVMWVVKKIPMFGVSE